MMVISVKADVSKNENQEINKKRSKVETWAQARASNSTQLNLLKSTSHPAREKEAQCCCDTLTTWFQGITNNNPQVFFFIMTFSATQWLRLRLTPSRRLVVVKKLKIAGRLFLRR